MEGRRHRQVTDIRIGDPNLNTVSPFQQICNAPKWGMIQYAHHRAFNKTISRGINSHFLPRLQFYHLVKSGHFYFSSLHDDRRFVATADDMERRSQYGDGYVAGLDDKWLTAIGSDLK